jgi:arginyl-tRNA synthetase
MRTILSQLEDAFRAAIHAALGFDGQPLVSVSQNDEFGDYQANAAMGLSKKLAETGEKTNPRAVAEKIKAKLDLDEMASQVSIAGPGFINIRLSPSWVAKQLQSAVSQDRLGVDATPNPQTVVIDYSAPNIAKEMHIGHLRPTNIGDAISRLVEFQGHNIIRQNHIGDWGTQFGMLVAYLLAHLTAPSSDPNYIIPGTPGASFISNLEATYRAAKKWYDESPLNQDQSRQTVVRLQAGNEEEIKRWQLIVDESRVHFEAVYKRLGVKLTRTDERGESFYNPFLADVVKELKESSVAVVSEGATVVWVKGFEAPLIIQKTGGGFGYATTDLAALRFRIRDLHAQRIIYVTDARQAQHFRQFFDAANRAGWTREVRLDHVMFGMICGPDGKPFKTKTGENVKLNDVLDEAEKRGYELAAAKAAEREVPLSDDQLHAIGRAVGIGAVKYYDLARDPIGNYFFDWNKMLALDGNTAPYLQYVYARIRSIFRKADAKPDLSAGVTLETPFELSLAKHMLRLGEIIDLASRELKPLHLCTYLYDLATKFSSFYENCPVLQADSATRASRLVLCEATARTMALGLNLLGIEHPKQM